MPPPSLPLIRIAFAVPFFAVPFLVVIPEGNLLLPLPLSVLASGSKHEEQTRF
jgi:hypothetical protein